jgi:DNA replication protein DnaC
MRLKFNPATGDGTESVVPIPCQCQKEAYEAAERRAEREKFKLDMAQRWEDGITDHKEMLRYRFADDDGQTPEILATCKRYVEQWEEMRADNIGLLFYGSVGRGKSFYASCIANALLEKMVPVAATDFQRLLNLLQNAKDRQKLIDRLRIYKLLVIDDLGAERDSAYAAEQVYSIINSRSRSEQPIIVTTNLTWEELENPSSMQYKRIYDRVLEMCPVRIKMVGESRRKGNAERRKEKARKLLLG